MLDPALALQQLPSALDPTTMAASQAFSQQLSTSEWLGPLAPVALSPFFGLAALSGIATYGPPWLQQRSALFQDGGALDNPWLFWTMATLALLTSLPRLTKVSKPVSLAAEKLEAYSAVIILIAVRMFGSQFQGDDSAEVAQTNTLWLSAGIGSVSLNIAMSAMAALNVLVVNLVKLCCEFAVWLIPIPTIDALVELGNKALCAGLMSLYCYSPWLASIVNLIILAVCAVVFLWAYRRVNYYRELIAGPALAWLLPGWFAQRGHRIRAFVESSTRRLPKYLPVNVDINGTSYSVTVRRGWRTEQWQLTSNPAESTGGWICQRLNLQDASGNQYVLCHRRWVKGDALYQAGSPVSVSASPA